ncbi:uncharacterized protein LOC112171301 [Rosa chinensis]|uniref:uncharacterized protein LOC112171301 n=1 Tax=Rosa chinensis TaxID=74649 RepID=UPI000D08E336|nr:uncharacterized protein LOC112171301 [Rosa chinensis]
MNLIFHNILGKILEVYIDDVVVKSKQCGHHITNLKRVFEQMRLHRLKMNPAKCVFGVQAGDFLGFIIHQRGIEVPEDKASAVINASSLRTKKELQRLLGKINFLRRFISNSAEYEALIIGLRVLLELGVRDVQICGDSLLVINQLQEKYMCVSCLLVLYLNRAIELLDQFNDLDLEYIPRERNFAANELAQLATGITLKYGVRERNLKVERRTCLLSSRDLIHQTIQSLRPSNLLI